MSANLPPPGPPGWARTLGCLMMGAVLTLAALGLGVVVWYLLRLAIRAAGCPCL